MEKVTLTTNVSGETVERLRELAGGQRKVGSYLDEVVSWIWENYESTGQVAAKDYTLRSAGDVNDELNTLRSQVAETMAEIHKLADVYRHLEARLQAQEDSGDNDA